MKARGRPKLPPEKKKGTVLAFRPTRETRRNLEIAAERSGRSLSAEIEWRLAVSFLDKKGQ